MKIKSIGAKLPKIDPEKVAKALGATHVKRVETPAAAMLEYMRRRKEAQQNADDAERMNWDDIWMGVAFILAKRSVDPKTKVAAIIVPEDNTQVLALGYNGDQKGGLNTVESEQPGHSGFIHAEVNALIKLDYNFPKRKIMFCTWSPCDMCAKLIINAGIDELVYANEYRIKDGVERLQKAGIIVRQHTP